MIYYKLRQEKQGGYLLDARQGRALQLSQQAYDLLLELSTVGHVPPGWPSVGLIRHFGTDGAEGQHWWQVLTQLELTTEPGLRALQVLPLTNQASSLPDDCLAAPARIYFELTRRCNLACRTCFNESHYPLPGELTTGEILSALQQLDRMGTFEIRFTGGEPTTHPDFGRIVAFAKALGFYVSLGTNGVYDPQVRTWIFESGVDWFIVSLDGDQASNDLIRGQGSYQQVKRTLDALAKRRQRVRLNMVVARHNIQSIETVARLADEYGVESLNLIPLRPYGRSARTMKSDMFDQRDFYIFIQQLQALRPHYRVQFITTLDLLDPDATTSHDLIVQKKRTCAAGVEAAVIGATGDVYGCSYSPASFPNSSNTEGRRLFVAGNLRQDPLNTIWLDSARWAVFRRLDVYKHPRCQACTHYGVRCVGSCPIMGYFQQGKPDAFDPYCFVDMLPTANGGGE